MKIVRQPEVVEEFHYDLRHEQKGETAIRVGMKPIPINEVDYPIDKSTLVGLSIDFFIIFEEFILSGRVTQLVQLIDRKFTQPADCTQEEINELVAPLFSLIQRLTYEITEVALDQPGIQLNFAADYN